MRHHSLITGRKIRVAVIGCGRISNNHFEAIKKHCERMELVGVCDIDEEMLAAAVARTGVPGFQNLSALLENTTAD